MLTYGSICSGIESTAIAWNGLGIAPLWFSEIAPFPCAVLANNYPDVENLGDMQRVAAYVLSGKIKAPDVLVAGTPCQPFSVGGMREGLVDERGALTIKFMELADANDFVRARARKPASIIVWENVPGVLKDKGNAFGCLLAALAGESCELRPTGRKWTDSGCVYGPQRTIAWRVLNAQYFGVAQRRRRVFVVASARPGFDPASVLFDLGSVRRDIAPIEPKAIATEVHVCGCGGRLPLCLGIFDCPKCGLRVSGLEPTWWSGAGITQTIDAVLAKHQTMPEKNRFPAVLDNGRLRFLTPTEAERLQGLPANYTQVSWRGKTAEDCPDGLRYNAVGNCMAVPVVRWLGRKLVAALEGQTTTAEGVTI